MGVSVGKCGPLQTGHEGRAWLTAISTKETGTDDAASSQKSIGEER